MTYIRGLDVILVIDGRSIFCGIAFTSKWSTIWLPTKARLILDVWRYFLPVDYIIICKMWHNRHGMERRLLWQSYGKLEADTLQSLYALSGKTSYRKISWSLEAARFGFKLLQWLCNLAGTSAALLPRCLSNFRAIRPLQHPISRLRDFTRFGGKTSDRLVNRGPAESHHSISEYHKIDVFRVTRKTLLPVTEPGLL